MVMCINKMQEKKNKTYLYKKKIPQKQLFLLKKRKRKENQLNYNTIKDITMIKREQMQQIFS